MLDVAAMMNSSILGVILTIISGKAPISDLKLWVAMTLQKIFS